MTLIEIGVHLIRNKYFEQEPIHSRFDYLEVYYISAGQTSLLQRVQ